MAPVIVLLPFNLFLFYVCPPYVLDYHGGAEFEGHFKEGVLLVVWATVARPDFVSSLSSLSGSV